MDDERTTWNLCGRVNWIAQTVMNWTGHCLKFYFRQKSLKNDRERTGQRSTDNDVAGCDEGESEEGQKDEEEDNDATDLFRLVLTDLLFIPVLWGGGLFKYKVRWLAEGCFPDVNNLKLCTAVKDISPSTMVIP